MITIKLTKSELFELIEITNLHIDNNTDKDLKSAYNKLLKAQPTIDHSKVKLGYEIPDFKPRERNQNATK
mgnify:FL=1|tara:strand:- start:1206 stop:1415 length:210 start_codon:yes stop_codon:yes gene_type:complete